MSTTATRIGQLTFDDFLAIAQEHQKADLLEGVIYMASPENTDDNKLGGWLYKLMSEYAEQTNQGEVFVTRVAFRLGEKRGPEPDVAFVTADRADTIQRGFVDGPPDIAVEVVSPDSAERDYDLKRKIYEQTGVREYWIIDPDEKKATFLRLQGDAFEEVEPQDGRFTSQVLQGFYLDVAWLWAKPRPSLLTLLPEMLNRSGAG